MSNIVTVGYMTEGSTDKRFLETIIMKTVEEMAFHCEGQIDVYDPIFIGSPKNQDFIAQVINAAKTAYNSGIFILCVHVDSDHISDKNVMDRKITPAIDALNEFTDGICKVVVPIVPVTMSEAWILADKELFKAEIGTSLSDESLKINKNPETVANPKALIEEALRIAQEDLPRRRDKLTIGELYQPIGQKISIEKLNNLSSFQKFKKSLEEAFKALNYKN